jgi:hypothetical protein
LRNKRSGFKSRQGVSFVGKHAAVYNWCVRIVLRDLYKEIKTFAPHPHPHQKNLHNSF